ncbi:MAG: hypothetical protein NC187_00895 [Candidatus Amulumruptor caecigallinarius]|nr:hypothetical protein [Candidatus Amulumruptor caecigallinarius]MCM1396033.1 hypothetical protein [Candidatus Amulumruptor caecigallinarius]MCM1453032.1 hypothetical protein [bacterium]
MTAANTSDTLITPPQRVPAWAMVRALAARRGLFTLICAAMLPAAALAVALVTQDLRWALVALMLIFVVAPMALLLVYFSYALRPDVARALLPHRLIIRRGDSVTIEYLPDEALSADEARRQAGKMPDAPAYPAAASPAPPRKIPAPETIPWQRVTLLRHTPRYWLLLHD